MHEDIWAVMPKVRGCVLIRGHAEASAVLLSASELEELTAVADRAVVIRDGRTVAELDGAQMSESAIMDAIAYGSAGTSQLVEAAQSAHIDDALEGDRHGS